MSYPLGYGDPYQRPSGPNLRWIGALIIAVIGIAIYMFQVEVNPVTGKRQHIAMSVDQEKALGLQAAPEMARKMGGEVDPRQDPGAALVAEVGRRIVQRSDAGRSPYVGNFHFVLLDDPETVNAFALPGGQVFITRGLFDQLENEAQLAGVLGHEVGHVIGRHAAEHMAQGQLGQLLTVAVGVGASGNRDDRGRQAAMVAAMANQMAQLKFSRNDESEADRFGLQYMAQAGYDPTAMLDVMRILKDVSKGSRQPEFLATHPLPETRLEEIRAILAKEYPNGVPEALTKGRPLDAGRVEGSRRGRIDSGSGAGSRPGLVRVAGVASATPVPRMAQPRPGTDRTKRRIDSPIIDTGGEFISAVGNRGFLAPACPILPRLRPVGR